MTVALISLVVLLVMAAALLSYWRVSVAGHQQRLDQLQVRVHVNGIRGKSTVTRLVAGVLREGGFITVAKTTGSAARVIERLGEETPIHRRGAATINEQIDVVAAYVDPDVEALVIECMAVRPLYQEYSQDYMVRSDITIITNVREDHQEEMGETLEQIADSLAVTTPMHGVLITAEERPHLRERLRARAEERGSQLLYADPESVSDDDMRGFDYLQFKDNVATGLLVARLLGIRRETALRGMWKSVPDVGVVRLRTYDISGKRVLWVPMFAANDRESVVVTFQTLQAQFPPGATVVGILNNRSDRGRRAELFAQMVPTDLAPYLGGLLLGERPGLLAVPGTLVALVAVALVAGLGAPSAADARGSGAALGLASGLLFGLFFLLLDGVDGAAGLWPVVSSRAVATVLLVGVAVGLRAPLLRTRASLGLAVGAGVLDAAANALFLLAVDRGLLSVVAVVVSLYPAATVLLARVVLGERMSGLQMAGLGAAVVAVTLLAVA